MTSKIKLTTVATLALTTIAAVAQNEKPNIIIINADDIGFGDFSCYGMETIKTPNVDRLANQGVRFTNAHTTSATSTPSRFGLLTGTYPWRTDGTGVAAGDAAMVIKPEQLTIADMLKRAGYATAAIGKWHLGIGDKQGEQNWNGQITPALDEIGFDYSMIMAATADRVPCVYIENGKVLNLDPNDPISVSYGAPFDGEPTGAKNPELLRIHPSHGHDQAIVDSISRIGYMKGGKSALWKDELIADEIVAASKNFIKNNATKPFFLFMATNDVHVPRVPHWRFKDKSGMGYRGDAILSFDWSVGEVLNTLDSLGIADNTLIILTSDNGPVLDDGYIDDAVKLVGNHRPAGEFRGGKYSAYEGGTRVPFIVKWTGNTKSGVVNNALISQVDIYATLAEITGQKLDTNEAGDSESYVKAMLGKSKKARQEVVLDAYARALIHGDWKYIRPSNRFKYAWQTGIETACDVKPQLFNLKNDISELDNVANENLELVAEMEQRLKTVEQK